MNKTDKRIDEVINLIKSLLEEGEQNIEIHMHSKYAIIKTDREIETSHHIYFEEERDKKNEGD